MPYCEHCEMGYEGGTPLFLCIKCFRPLRILTEQEANELFDYSKSKYPDQP